MCICKKHNVFIDISTHYLYNASQLPLSLLLLLVHGQELERRGHPTSKTVLFYTRLTQTLVAERLPSYRYRYTYTYTYTCTCTYTHSLAFSMTSHIERA
jgi:hypothetical protein